MDFEEFHYLLEKIENAHIINKPFPYIYIPDFFSDEHLSIILND